MFEYIDQNNTLLIEINKRKNTLLDIASTSGLSSKETIEYSQELDNLIFLYQWSKQKIN